MKTVSMLIAVVVMTFANAAHAAVTVSIDINDPNAPQGTVRSFSGNGLTLGSLKTKVWEYNAFLVDPYFRQPDMSDAQFVWCQPSALSLH